jgi:dsRNA-specific ribonuclease
MSNRENNSNNVKVRQINSCDEDIRIEKNLNGTETYVFDPYNPNNVLITRDEVQNLLKTYGINAEITNFELYKRAFVHKSYIRRPTSENENNNIVISPKPDNCVQLFTKSNERLEFMGDGILECITKYCLYKRFPKENEGFMTEKKIALVKNESIGRMAYEMGLHNWFIISKYAESKQTRVNFKKLGCLFESFLGALFLDFNKISVKDEHGWFENVFMVGPGFQMAQVFVEAIFERHVNWIELILTDDNYKNILQVKIQKEFKITPDYIELGSGSSDNGYRMGVFLCLGQEIHSVKYTDSLPVTNFRSFQEIHNYMSIHNRILVFLGEGTHKLKKRAEQQACQIAIANISAF